MADGVGGMIANLMMGNPSAQLSQALAGPQPSPQAAAAAPGGPQTPGSTQLPSAPSQAPAQATQSPPDLAQLYLRLMQSQQMGESFNRNMALFAGGFKGPPGGAEQIMRGMTGGGQQDAGALLQNLLQMQQTQRLANMPAPPGVSQSLWNILDPTGRVKLAGDIASQQAGLGGPPVVQEMHLAKQQYMKDNGITDPNDPHIPRKYNYPDEFIASSSAEGKTKDEIALYKTTAVEDYGALDEKLAKNLGTVNQLLGNVKGQGTFDDTVTALKTPKPTTGLIAANMPALGGYNPLSVSQQVSNQAVALKSLIGELSAETMGGMKNIRNINEFKAVVSSLTAALDAANSPEKIKTALEAVQKQLLRARAIATASAGHPLSSDLADQLGPDRKTFLDSSSQYYNGATVEEAPKGGAAPLSDEDLINKYLPK